MTEADLPWFIDLRNRVRHSLHDQRAFTLEEANCWFQQRTTDYLVLTRGGLDIGYARWRRFCRSYIEIGIDLHPQFHGLGFAKPAYGAVAQHFHRIRETHFVLRVLDTNLKALRLYESLGFVEVPMLSGSNDRFMISPVATVYARASLVRGVSHQAKREANK